MRKIILASTSPRRKELLTQLIGDNFIIVSCDYEENNTLLKDPKKLVMHHSLMKARSVVKKFKSGIIISADSLVYYKNHILGKPHTKEKAKRMLELISGKTVNVVTGIAVIDIDKNKEIVDYENTKVKIKKLTDEEITQYIACKEPLDRAGAFAIQQKGAFMIEKTKGDYLGAVGLPLFKLNKILSNLDVSIFDYN